MPTIITGVAPIPRSQIAMTARGLITENWHVDNGQGATGAISGQVFLQGLGLRAGDVTTGLALIVGAGGTSAGFTQAKVGLYTGAGVLAASSASDGTKWTASNALVQSAFLTSYTAPADGLYYGAILFTGTTLPTLWRGSNSAAPSTQLSGGKFPYLVGATAQADLPSVAAVTGGGNQPSYWVGLY